MRAACAALFTAFVHTYAPTPQADLPADYLKIPIVRQAHDYTCGPAALAAILNYWNVFDGMESDLYKPLQTSEELGTHPRRLARYARSLGLKVWFHEGSTLKQLQQALNDGTTVILDIQAWRTDKTSNWKDTWDDGHYVVLVGMDDRFIYLMDPSTASGYTYIPIDEFMDRWHDYEIEGERRREYIQLGIFIKGSQKIPNYPRSLIPLE